MKKIVLIAALLAISIVYTACVPKPTVDGEIVQVKAPMESMQCKHLGNTRIALRKTNALLLTNNQEKIAETLLADARNLGSRIGADTVVADKIFPDKSQAFRFYICGQTTPAQPTVVDKTAAPSTKTNS